MKTSGLKSITDIWTSLNRRSLRDVLEELSESEARKPKFVVFRRRIGNRWNKIGNREDEDYIKMFYAKTIGECESWVSEDILKMTWDFDGLMTPKGIVSSKGPECSTYTVGGFDFMLDYLVEPAEGVK